MFFTPKEGRLSSGEDSKLPNDSVGDADANQVSESKAPIESVQPSIAEPTPPSVNNWPNDDSVIPAAPNKEHGSPDRVSRQEPIPSMAEPSNDVRGDNFLDNLINDHNLQKQTTEHIDNVAGEEDNTPSEAAVSNAQADSAKTDVPTIDHETHGNVGASPSPTATDLPTHVPSPAPPDEITPAVPETSEVHGGVTNLPTQSPQVPPPIDEPSQSHSGVEEAEERPATTSISAQAAESTLVLPAQERQLQSEDEKTRHPVVPNHHLTAEHHVAPDRVAKFPSEHEKIDLSGHAVGAENRSPEARVGRRGGIKWLLIILAIVVLGAAAYFFLQLNNPQDFIDNPLGEGTATNQFTAVQAGSELDETRKTDLTNLQKALEQYYAANKSYPVGATATSTDATDSSLLALVPQYLASLPTDPAGASYDYQSADGTTYTITATFDADVSSDGVASTISEEGTGYTVILTPGVSFGTTSTTTQTITDTGASSDNQETPSGT